MNCFSYGLNRQWLLLLVRHFLWLSSSLPLWLLILRGRFRWNILRLLNCCDWNRDLLLGCSDLLNRSGNLFSDDS